MRILEIVDNRDDYQELMKHRVNIGQNENVFHFSSWPPTPQELLQAQRKIFQDPQWLSHYKYFGFNFQQINSDKAHYDRRKQVYHFYDVPAIFKDGKPDQVRIDVDLKGNAKASNQEYSVPLPEAVAVCVNYARSAAPFAQFLNGRYFVRFGPWSNEEVSKNFLNGGMERGVSAYDAEFDLETRRWNLEAVDNATTAGTMQSLIYSNRDIFLVTGTQVAEGSDGEPVLKNLKVIKRLTKKDIFVGGMFDPYEDER